MFVRLDLGKCDSFTLLYVSAHQLPFATFLSVASKGATSFSCQGKTIDLEFVVSSILALSSSCLTVM
jgi:hypothetical protein